MENSSPARPSHTRAHNDRLALELLLARGPLTAPELADGTGLSRPTIADLVGRLQRADLIEVVGEDDRARRGPRARLYGIAGRRAHVVGLDLRADGIRVAVADLSGTVVAERAAPLKAAPQDAIAAALAVIDDAVDQVGADLPHTIAVGAPGHVAPATRRQRPRGGVPVGRLLGVPRAQGVSRRRGRAAASTGRAGGSRRSRRAAPAAS